MEGVDALQSELGQVIGEQFPQLAIIVDDEYGFHDASYAAEKPLRAKVGTTGLNDNGDPASRAWRPASRAAPGSGWRGTPRTRPPRSPAAPSSWPRVRPEPG